VSGSSATGSFSGGATVSFGAPTNLATLCGAKRGIRSLTLAGTVTIGTTPSTTVTCKAVSLTANGIVANHCSGRGSQFKRATIDFSTPPYPDYFNWNGGTDTLVYETRQQTDYNVGCDSQTEEFNAAFVFTGQANWVDCQYLKLTRKGTVLADSLATGTVLTVKT
jgi:hypothetical protein